MKNYLSSSIWLTAGVLLLLIAVAPFAPASVLGVKLKQTNILSDLISDSLLRSELHLKNIHATVAGDFTVDWGDEDSIIKPTPVEEVKTVKVEKQILPVGAIPIEDYSTDQNQMANLIANLSDNHGTPHRIAVLGDSFIEGDIMVGDLRRMIQKQFGGSGPGFVGITSAVAAFRSTVGHRFSEDWKTNSIIKNQDQAYTIAGYNYIPSEGSWVEYTASKASTGHFSQARLLLTASHSGARVRVSVNGGVEQEIELESKDQSFQSIILAQDSIGSIRLAFNQVQGLTLYGVLLDSDSGIAVDNYSIRGNSGLPMSSVSGWLSAQYQALAPVDLLVVQYGLNVISQENVDFGGYIKQLSRVVEHLMSCYPGVPVLMMGVSDRSIRNADDSYSTMPGVASMDRAQRQLAERLGICYWSTYDAMLSMGGMPKFVENNWAAKDYTHLGQSGGRRVAQKFMQALGY